MEGRIVKGQPQRRPHNFIDDHDWDASALLAKEHPDDSVLAAEHIPYSRYVSLRGYRRAPFQTDEGRIVVSLRDSQVEDDGKRYGDVYFHWEPKTTKKKGTK